MKRPVSAALLSALVFPGVGHFFLRQNSRGLLLASIGLATLVVLISVAVGRARQIVEKIQLGEIEPDIATIMQSISEQSANGDTQLGGIATAFFVAVWLWGIVDAYRAGRKSDQNIESSD